MPRITTNNTTIDGINVERIRVSGRVSNLSGKAAGNYITLYCDGYDCEAEISALSRVLSDFLQEIKRPALRTIVAGLGNPNVTADSLGVKTAQKVFATAHLNEIEEFAELKLRDVCVIEPGVKARTGIDTAQQLKYIVKGVKPDCFIVIDSLSCADRKRLARTIQITDTGILQGSGMNINRAEISRKTFGVPVIAIGVPTVMVMNDNAEGSKPLFVVPYDIDNVISHYARVISVAINNTLNPTLDKEDVEMLFV